MKDITPAPGKTAAHVEFTRDGKYALVSVWDIDGALVVYDAEDTGRGQTLANEKTIRQVQCLQQDYPVERNEPLRAVRQVGRMDQTEPPNDQGQKRKKWRLSISRLRRFFFMSERLDFEAHRNCRRPDARIPQHHLLCHSPRDGARVVCVDSPFLRPVTVNPELFPTGAAFARTEGRLVCSAHVDIGQGESPQHDV